jgi:hypothetical protein
MNRLTAFALSLGLAMAGFAQASDHYAIIRNSDNEQHPVATVDLAALDWTAMTVRVLGPAGGFQTVQLRPTESFYGSADLVAINSGGLEPGEARLVRCTSDVPVTTAVMLRGDQGEVFIPLVQDSLGARFFFPVGDLGKGVTLLVGNPNLSEIEVDIAHGSGSQRLPAPALGVLAVPLMAANERYVVTGVGPSGGQPFFVAALVFSEKGRSSRMVMLTPGF